MLTKCLETLSKFELLKEEVLAIVAKHTNEKNQLSCQTTIDNVGNWYDSVGSLSEIDEADEKKYNVIQPELTGTYLEELIKKHNSYRTRIMILDPRKCYSVHRDTSPRLHIPIITNMQSWMVWPHHNTTVQLHAGVIHWVDTTKHHTFFNGDLTLRRIHVIMNVGS